MGKLVALINMTLDGFCDHTAGIANEETHAYFNDQLRNAGTLLYGRVTYQMMESYWPGVVKDPTGNKPLDDFAVLIDSIPKIVFSRTLQTVEWKNTTLKKEIVAEEITALKQQESKDLLVGSPGLIVAMTQLNLVDEYRLLVHPVILGSGLVLFKNIAHQIDLKLLETKPFGCGSIALHYETLKK